VRAEGFEGANGRLRCQLFEDELYGINDTIERVVDRFGRVVTNFTRIKSGSFLRAHGGSQTISAGELERRIANELESVRA